MRKAHGWVDRCRYVREQSIHYDWERKATSFHLDPSALSLRSGIHQGIGCKG